MGKGICFSLRMLNSINTIVIPYFIPLQIISDLEEEVNLGLRLFGFTNFRTGQKDSIMRILKGTSIQMRIVPHNHSEISSLRLIFFFKGKIHTHTQTYIYIYIYMYMFFFFFFYKVLWNYPFLSGVKRIFLFKIIQDRFNANLNIFKDPSPYGTNG